MDLTDRDDTAALHGRSKNSAAAAHPTHAGEPGSALESETVGTTRSLPMSSRRTLAAAFVFVLWTLLAVLNASQRYLVMLGEAEYRMSWLKAFAWQAPGWYVWALYTPVILWLGRRAPVERRHWRRAVAVHLPASILATLGYVAVNVGVARFLEAEARAYPVGQVFSGVLFAYLHVNLLLYGAVLGAGHAVEYYRRYRERELAASQLEARLARARLQALRMQLNPHFLFNALHAIATLVRKDQNGDAVRMIAELSDLLRLTLDEHASQEIRLEEELEFVRRYLDIEKIRFGDRLRVHFDVERELLDARIPTLLLQPLVENAIKHGIGPRAAAGEVRVAARRIDGMLELRVADDGPGLPAGWGIERAGVGLANTRERLERLYGARQRLDLATGGSGGTIATVTIPFHVEAATLEAAP